ncbi:hypothetical protein HG536_0C01400 [Torulaspora globosa]|uniref:Acyl-protein thioesterase 1 n=1 Tax=Torulaspora globosa TaxID=48254 RepID=A0A7G3ZEN6_9SACH|nr:uncharacterized protein HG536_0C01400 [Torulaspora globosa]QLL31972.1 hypothetical protein HG536_0C01400 [Torulaspora globosa]
MSSAVRVASRAQPAEQALIIFHGLGDTGSGWSFLADFLQRDPAFSRTRFVFPNAPSIPITANGGMKMPAWFDILEWTLSPTKADTEGVFRSLDVIQRCVQEQIDSGIKPENIIVGGFSQGAAISLAATMTLPMKVGAFVSLSGFCCTSKDAFNHTSSKNLATPVFHGHGDQDPIVPLKNGQIARDFYTRDCGLTNYTFKVYPGLEHSTSPEEMVDLIAFIKKVFRL